MVPAVSTGHWAPVGTVAGHMSNLPEISPSHKPERREVQSDKGKNGVVLAVATGQVSAAFLTLLRTIAHTMTFFTAVDTRYNRSIPSKFYN